ncbi:MAG: uroporphyrinogen decarboxylase family protein, partial [Halanaerobiales bacterium]|nr:uroporphyrinogen decarboxylase family protein [Halanaerobiales bacterium]
MTPYERVFKRLEGKEVDKVPNLNIIMTFAAKFIDVPYSKYVTDYRYLVEGNIKCCEEFGIDMVSAISDPCRESHDLGATIKFPFDDVPQFDGNLIDDYKKLKKLTIIDPLKGKRMLDRIKAIELFKKEVGKVYPILGWVEGGFAEACDLRGMNQTMFDIHENTKELKDLIEFCTKQAIWFAKEQIKAGADFIGIGDAAASLIGPKNYNEFVLPYEKKIIKAVHNLGAKVKLHICGNINPLLEILLDTEADIIDLDWMVDFKRAVKIFEGKVSVNGNFDPVKILMQGSPKKVKKAVKECIKLGDSTTFISAGCEVPASTPKENMYAVNQPL